MQIIRKILISRIFWGIFFSVPVMGLYAQDQEIVKFLDDFRVNREANYPTSRITTSYETILGSPFLFPDYREALIVMDDNSRYHGLLRYDLYTGEMEFRVKGHTYWISPKERVKKIILDGKTFIFLNTKENKNRGYYEVLSDGPVRLLARHLITFREAEEARPYQDAKPARFENKRTLYYLQKQNDPSSPEPVRNKKNLITLLNDHAGEISAFIRKEHLSVNQPADLKKIISYYNSLISQK